MIDDDVLAAVDARLADHFGHRPERASLSFVGVEPIEVLRYEPAPGERAYVTLGMSRQVMSPAGAAVLSADGPRAELLLQVHVRGGEFADLWRRLVVLAAAPTVEGIVYVDGMTVELGEALASGSACVGVLVGRSGIADVSTPAGPVAVLQALPATSTELAWCRVRGSAALRELWREHGTDLRDLHRASVPLG